MTHTCTGKAGIGWAGLSDVEGTAPRQLRLFIIQSGTEKLNIQINKEAGVLHLSSNGLCRGAVFGLEGPLWTSFSHCQYSHSNQRKAFPPP